MQSQLDEFAKVSDKAQRQKVIFKFVKKVWTKYDKNKDGFLQRDESRPLIDTEIAPLIYRKGNASEKPDQDGEKQEGNYNFS